MAKALCFLIFAVFACQVRGLELDSLKNALHHLFSDSREEEAEIRGYDCTTNVKYPNKFNCASYIQCTNGRPVMVHCPSFKLHYNVKTQRCESPCDAQCDKTLTCQCQWETCGSNVSCHLPSKTGPCLGNFPRYYFDKPSGLCKKFVYGGCDGNENNFERLRDCEKFCRKSGKDINVCKQPKEVGTCKAAIPRWWYNDKTKTCEKFIYGGCEGNGNNFATKEICEQSCPKKAATEEGVEAPDFTCDKDGLHPIKRNCSAFIQCTNGRPVIMPCPAGLHFSVKTMKCERPCDAKCDRTLACKCKWNTCGKRNCLLSAQTGICKSYQPRYYFDKSTGICKPFVYSGCLGNENNFLTKAECQVHCGHAINVCRLPVDKGSCDALLPRYFFNSKTGKCQKFIYEGCGGNANNFLSVKECELKCLRS